MIGEQLLRQFLIQHDVTDVKQCVVGELLEFSTQDATYFYGNGELIICPSDPCVDETTYVVDNSRGFDEFVRL